MSAEASELTTNTRSADTPQGRPTGAAGTPQPRSTGEPARSQPSGAPPAATGFSARASAQQGVPQPRTPAGGAVRGGRAAGVMSSTLGRGAPVAAALRRQIDRGRRPAATRPGRGTGDPGPRQLILISVWGAALGVLGLMCAFWALVKSYSVAATWYTPAITVIGVAGIALSVAAFLFIQRRRISRQLLGAASVALFLVIILNTFAG